MAIGVSIRMFCKCGPSGQMHEVHGVRQRVWNGQPGPGGRPTVVNRCSECGRKWPTIAVRREPAQPQREVQAP